MLGNLYMLLTEFIEYHAKVRPDSPILFQGDERLTFFQAVEEARQIASWLQAEGVGAGDRVAILGENSIDHILLLLASSHLRAVMVPLNYRLAAPELVDVLEDAGAKLLVISDPAMESLKTSLQKAMKSDTRIVNRLGRGPALRLHDRAGDEQDTIIQLYTSGTTGRPKGVQISHNNVEALTVSSTLTYLSKPGMGTLDLVVAPLFHIGGLGSALIPIMSGGAVILHRQFDPEAVVRDIEHYGVNTLFLVPAMIQAILTAVPDIDKRDFSSLKQLTYGASPISPSLLQLALDLLGCKFIQLFGMTETTGAVVALTPEDHERALAEMPELLQSCGRAMAGVDIRICNSEGIPLPAGETGEIVIRSGNNTRGYWQRPEETGRTIKNGWIHTGDAGYMDEEGYLYIRDRIKDMVVTGGENVYPVEVERVLAGHPSVLEVAVIGVPDKQYGEALLAICTLNRKCKLTVEDLVGFCRGKIAGYKIPRQLALMDSLPRNPSGKILKTALRERYGRGVV